MSFPGLIFGDYGDEKVQSSAKIGSLPLGARMILPDGRVYAHAKAGGTTLAAGNMTQQANVETSHETDLEIPSAVAVGATTLTVTMAGTVITKDQYADGWLVINDDNAEGEIYRIASNNSAASVTAATINLEPGDGIATALRAATTEVALRANEFSGLNLWEAGTVEGIPCGLPTRDITANYYFWVQRRGVAGCFVDNTHVLGQSVCISDDADGALAPWAGSAAATSSFQNEVVGYTVTVQASTEYGACYLTMD